jgi:hypothetical protein
MEISIGFDSDLAATVHDDPHRPGDAGLLMPAVTAVPAALWQPVAAVTSGFE